MPRLAEGLSRRFGRVESLALGGEEERRAAERALARGHALEARVLSRALLLRVPDSPLGLALWADAAEACGLHDEVVTALERLVEQVPWRQEVWLRLGQAALRSGTADARGALERAAAGTDDPLAAPKALLMLADLDIAANDCARAARWLDRIPYHPSEADPELALRLTADSLRAFRQSLAPVHAGVAGNARRLSRRARRTQKRTSRRG